MPLLMEEKNCISSADHIPLGSLDEATIAMGKRLQAEYVEGAIPYLREHEPKLWAQLETLDLEDSPDALLAYERLFFEGLRRFVCHQEALRQAA